MAPTRSLLFQTLAPDTPDADLLRRFADSRDEPAFAELVRRHGPVVYRVCRRLLGPSAADDAFQATFLVLACQADRVRKAGSVGSWLVGVAGRVARQTRRTERRFPASGTRQGAELPADTRHPDGCRSPELSDLASVLDAELTRLPDHLRGPVVVCLVRGRTQEQAVAELGTSVRTLRRRLDEAKRLLRERLERRGVVPAVAAGLVAGAGGSAAVSPALASRTVSLVSDFLAGGARTVPAAVLANGVATTMIARKVTLAVVTAAVGLTALGVGWADDPRSKPAVPPAETGAPLVPPDTGKPVKISITGPSALLTHQDGWAVAGPGGPVNRALLGEARHLYRYLATEWVGKEVPADRARVAVEYKKAEDAGGHCELGLDGPTVHAKIVTFGPLDDVLETQLPAQMILVVLTAHSGSRGRWPAWVEAGVSAHYLGADERERLDLRCRGGLNQGQGIRLRAFFGRGRKGEDWPMFDAQAYSLTTYLLGLPAGKGFGPPVLGRIPHLGDLFARPENPRTRFVAFIELGAADGWDAAAKAVYGAANLDALEGGWIESLRKAPERKSDPVPADPTRIPPVKFGR